MIADFTDTNTLPAETEFLVIGGGTLGLPLTLQLAERTGRRVVCLESGGWRQESDVHPLNAAVNEGAEYAGASQGRFRGLGGTSTRWGGALIPYQPADMAGWPVGWDDLAPYLAEVEQLFGLDPGPYDDEQLQDRAGPALQPRLAKWPPFSKRNVGTLLHKRLKESQLCQVVMNATVTGLSPQQEGVTAQVCGVDGRAASITAKHVIVAAGAIETTRQALLLDRQMNGAVSAQSPALGRYFSDHLSVETGRIDPVEREALNRLFGFRFAPSGMMRNLRFEVSSNGEMRSTIRPGFVHVGYATGGDSGFDHLRDVMQRIQRRRMPTMANLAGLTKNLPWLVRAVKWRFADARQLFPDGADLVTHTVIEQEPQADNRITLSEAARDVLGLPLPVINWQVSEADIANLHALTDVFEHGWRGGDLAALGSFNRFPRDRTGAALSHSGGIYHPTGSTRMGVTAGEGVVDANLCLFAEPRIQLCSTSVLPSGGGANPTMTALMLAMRLADQHGRGI